MTQNQLEWMQQSGLDPAEYDMTPDGRVVRRQVAQAPVEPQREVMSPLRAAGTSFLGNLVPSAAGLGGAKLGMMAGAPFGPVGVGIGAIGGGAGAGYLAGRGQEAVLEKVAPSAIEEMRRAETDQPIYSYLGGFAPNALAFRPSMQGMSGLLRPTVRGTETLGEALAKPEFLAPAANIAANVAGSTAGQLVNMSQGGEFSAPRFAADVALGTLFNRPTALGRKFGFQDIPEPRREAPGDLAAAREQAEFMEYPPSEFATPREERLDIGAEKIAPERFFTPEGKPLTEKAMAKDYTNWWKSETEPTTDLIKGAAEEIKMKVPRERLAELAQDSEVGAALRDPSRMPAFIAKQAEQSLEQAYQDFLNRPKPFVEMMAPELDIPSSKGPSMSKVLKSEETAMKLLPEAETQNATEAAREIYTRLQRAPEEYTGKITQEDINLANEIANRRGLKIELDRAYAGSQQVRGLYMVDADGNRIIRVNPLMATADTAIHEIGHDVFTGVTNKGMRRSLLDSALDSPAYKAELAARQAEVEQGKITQEQANDIALEEGLIQAFGEQMPSVKRSELRAWYQAFKASMKQLVMGKMSPEDALAWMHYATTEAVPWKGVAVAKTGGTEERFSRAKEAGRRLGVDDLDWENMSSRGLQREVNLEDIISGVMPELKIYQEKPNVFREDVVISRQPNLLSNEGAFGRAYTTGARNEGHVVIDGALWDAAVANEPGSRERFVKVLKHELGHIDDAPNVGEYGSARDERVADEFAARYQRAQQETPEFKAWFGESKVVDADGKPLVMYHGTGHGDITEFQGKRNVAGHFTLEPEFAADFALDPYESGSSGYPSWDPSIYPVYLKAEKIFDVRDSIARTEIKSLRGPVSETRGWDWTVLEKPVVIQELKAKGYDSYLDFEHGSNKRPTGIAVFDSTQIKSATANRGTFSPESADIRYQRGLGSEIVRPSELDYLASKGGPFERVAAPLRAAYNTRDFKAGEWANKYSLAAELRPEDQKRLFMHLSQEFDNNTRSTPPADLRAAYDQIRNEYLPAIVNDYNAAGMTVRDTAGLRARGSNPTYIPLHAIAEEVKNILTTKQGSPEYDKLKNDFIQWNTQLRQADGASLAEAQKYAQEKFKEKVDITTKPPGIESGIPFSGARKPEGYPLPPSWRSDDLIGNLNNYTRRSATDYAYQKHVESSPEAMAALGAKKYFNDQPIPSAILASTANVINDPSVQSILREYRGTPAQKVGGNLTDLGKAVSVATIGPVSKVGDIGTSLVKGLVYLPAGEYTSGLVDFTNRLGNWAALKERSYASGLNKRDAAQNMRQVLGIGDDSVSFMSKAAETLSKFTGLNQLETVARTIAQGWGETVVKYNKRLALGGDKNATQMLDTLSPDWRTRSDADLAAQVGRLLQGSYDMRQLPASVLEGAAAPYLTWSKWSIGQYDSFMKYALQPAMQGNVKPLIGQMLIGVLGGGAVSAVQEWINNREGKDITWNELESWMQQNQGQLGADGGQLLGQKLLTMAQKLGTFGFAGDVAKMVIDTAAGGTAQGVATMPALDAVYDVSKRVAAATKALDDGEDFGLVLKALMQDSVIGHLQVARLARNWLDEDENMRYDDRRRRRLYDELTGMPSRGGAFAVNYSNLSEREFERGEIGEKTGEEALGLVMRAREQVTTPEDYASRIRKLKTAQNAIMPSLERQPLKAARYLSWLEGTEEGLGSETVKRYLIREQEDKYRKSLVEGLSGLR